MTADLPLDGEQVRHLRAGWSGTVVELVDGRYAWVRPDGEVGADEHLVAVADLEVVMP